VEWNGIDDDNIGIYDDLRFIPLTVISKLHKSHIRQLLEWSLIIFNSLFSYIEHMHVILIRRADHSMMQMNPTTPSKPKEMQCRSNCLRSLYKVLLEST
jgi:hypothetical protein